MGGWFVFSLPILLIYRKADEEAESMSNQKKIKFGPNEMVHVRFSKYPQRPAKVHFNFCLALTPYQKFIKQGVFNFNNTNN